MRCRSVCLLHHALDFFQLFHQVQLRRQAACGVDQHHVFAARLARAYGIKTHSGRVAAFLADDLHSVAVGPHRELLARCRAKGVGSGQQHAGALLRQMPRELANRRGFARAIDAHHHDDGRLVLAYHQRLFQRRQQLGQAGDQAVFQRHRVRDAVVFDLAAQLGDQILGGGHARVSHQQRALKVFKQSLVDLRAAKHARDAGRSFAQARLEFVQPFLPLRRYGGQRGNVDGRDQLAANHRAARGRVCGATSRTGCWIRSVPGRASNRQIGCRQGGHRRCSSCRRGFFLEKAEHLTRL